MKKKILELTKKYQKYLGNIEWHIKTNKPWGSELEKCEQQLKCYKEILADLKLFKIEL